MRGRILGARAALLGAAMLGLSAAQAQPPSHRSYERPAAEHGAARVLEARVRDLGRAFPGEVGIAVREVDARGGLLASWNGGRFFPQQSVSKFWVAVTALSRVDAGALDLDRSITITRADLTLFNQPIAAQIGRNGYTTTLGSLLFRAITQSDNTCNDLVLRHAGGPSAVRAMLERNRLEGVRFGPGERLLQAGIAGLRWNNAFSVGPRTSRPRGVKCRPAAAGTRSNAISTTRSMVRLRTGSPAASPACSAANCSPAPPPRACSRS